MELQACALVLQSHWRKWLLIQAATILTDQHLKTNAVSSHYPCCWLLLSHNQCCSSQRHVPLFNSWAQVTNWVPRRSCTELRRESKDAKQAFQKFATNTLIMCWQHAVTETALEWRFSVSVYTHSAHWVLTNRNKYLPFYSSYLLSLGGTWLARLMEWVV